MHACKCQKGKVVSDNLSACKCAFADSLASVRVQEQLSHSWAQRSNNLAYEYIFKVRNMHDPALAQSNKPDHQSNSEHTKDRYPGLI